jgi:hypothetical protein
MTPIRAFPRQQELAGSELYVVFGTHFLLERDAGQYKLDATLGKAGSKPVKELLYYSFN